ncbi:MAG: hypothetical protein ABIE70_04810 [bacterium]
MHALLLATLLSMPLYPVNPIQQDTVAMLNAHITAGVSAPDGIISTGFEATSKIEMMLIHPVVVRAGLDYRAGSLRARRYPEGTLHGPTFSVEALYYRGTNRLTGFVGGGVVLTKYFVHLSGSAADSLMANHQIYGMYVEPKLGYRFSAGLRIRGAMSIEIGLTSVTTDFLFRKSTGLNTYRQWREPVKFRDVRISIGYVLPILDPGR